MTNIVFMGSPQFAVPTLATLAGEHTILAVFTQPDKPAGRGKVLTAVPVKRWAAAHGLPLYQPQSLRKDPSALETLRDLRPEAIVVAAYGLILPQAILDIPAHGCLNVHASLLPRHRGAAPIAAAILAGDAETGITIIRMQAELDTGPILTMAREPIRADDTTQSLSERLADLGACVMADTLPKYLRGEIVPQPQPEEGASYSPKIDKARAQIDWRQPAIQIERMVRAYTPWPGAFTFWNGTPLKILRAEANERISESANRPGQVVRMEHGSIGVITGSGVMVLKEIQLAGRKALKVEEFVHGQPALIGSRFAAHDP